MNVSWIWDEHRLQYYYFDSSRNTYIYQSGEKISAGLSDSGYQSTNSASTQPATAVTGPAIIGTVQNEWDHCDFISELGRGGQAIVRKVRSHHDNKEYALKSYAPTSNSDDIRQEISIMQKCSNCSYVAQLHYAYHNIQKHEYHLVMSPVAPWDLRKRIQEQYNKPAMEYICQNFVDRAFLQLLTGLDEIYRVYQVRHKDIKPHNILVTAEENLVYSDFGLAIDFSSTGNATTHNGGGCTPFYAPPEILNDQPRNQKSDVFSLGCVLFEILLARSARLTGDQSWWKHTLYSSDTAQYKIFCVRSYEGDIDATMDRMLADRSLRELHRYIPIVKWMTKYNRDDRPDASDVLPYFEHGHDEL